MGIAQKPSQVCLIAALCYNDEIYKNSAISRLENEYGAIQFELAPILFSYTNYYADEMGGSLEKMYVSFEQFIGPEHLPQVKHFTNAIENDLAIDGKRNINIDPGYVEVPKLILATTKNFSHRIYIGNSIYGDVQLIWQNGKFNPNPWTYPDYKDERTLSFFENIRNEYFKKIKGKD